MSRIILLSSSDEDTTDEPPKKRIKPTLIKENNIDIKPMKTVNRSNADAVIISSDDESGAYEHHTIFQSSLNFCKTENAEAQNNDCDAGEKEHNFLSTDICVNVTNTNLETDTADQCGPINNGLQEPLPNIPIEYTNEIHIEKVFTSPGEDSLSTPFQDGCHRESSDKLHADNVTASHIEDRLSISIEGECLIESPNRLRIDNVFTSRVDDSLSTPLQDGSHIKSSNKLHIDNVFTTYEEDHLSTPLQEDSPIENHTMFQINNVFTSHVNDSSFTPSQDESPLGSPNKIRIHNVFTSRTENIQDTRLSTYSNSLPEETLNPSVLPDNLAQMRQPDGAQQRNIDMSSPSYHTLEDKSMSENKIPVETTARPIDNETTVDEMDAFLKTCSRSVKKTKYESLREKFSMLNELYQKYILNKGYNDEVGTFLAEHITEASKSAADAVLTFNEVLEYFKAASMEEVEIAPEYKKKVKVLLKTCLKLIHRIKQLECAEVDWDDDENSAYIQEDRYKKRLVKVFNLYCKYVKMNPYQGRLTHKKLNFSASNYKQINAAINKNCQKHEKFPSYKDIEHIVRKCVKKYDLPLSDSKIHRESEKCFKTVGRFLQKRRKQELYESHFYFIKDGNDPASMDKQLDRCLRQNFAEGMKKIEIICERYAEMQMEQSQVQESEDDTASESSSNEESDSS